MTKECRSPNDKMSPYSLSAASVLVIRHLSLVRHSLIRASPFLLLIFLPALQAADNISVVGSKPQWSVLEHYQETITRDDFARLIQSVYCTHGFAPDLIEINEKTARIMINRSAQEFVALDPGHLGGKWAKMEERWFQVGASEPVQEGDLVLRVARLLAPRLRELGAKVSFIRNSNEPITAKRPDDFQELARKILIKNGVPRPRTDVLDPNEPAKEQTIRWQSEILFYRYSEIRRRAALVNFKLHPDLVLCLHLNAEGWGDPNNPTLTDTNHLHLLVNGSYLAEELEFDDERFEMIRRLLSRAYDEELPLADTIAAAMARETGVPVYQYPTTNSTTKVGTSGYVYARNLLATRLYRCPVVYCEPYVMNSKDVFARIQAGDYEGVRDVNGAERKSIFREYADSVTEGLVDYYSKARPTTARSGGSAVRIQGVTASQPST